MYAYIWDEPEQAPYLRDCIVHTCVYAWTDHLPEILNLCIYKKLYVHVQIANSSLNAKIYHDHGVLTHLLQRQS